MKKLILSVAIMGMVSCAAQQNNPFRMTELVISTDDCQLPANKQCKPSIQCAVAGGMAPYTLESDQGEREICFDGIFSAITQEGEGLTITLNDSQGTILGPHTFNLVSSIFQKIILSTEVPHQLSYEIVACISPLEVQVTLTGPEEFSQTLTETKGSFTNLVPGNYRFALQAQANASLDDYKVTLLQDALVTGLIESEIVLDKNVEVPVLTDAKPLLSKEHIYDLMGVPQNEVQQEKEKVTPLTSTSGKKTENKKARLKIKPVSTVSSLPASSIIARRLLVANKAKNSVK